MIKHNKNSFRKILMNMTLWLNKS